MKRVRNEKREGEATESHTYGDSLLKRITLRTIPVELCLPFELARPCAKRRGGNLHLKRAPHIGSASFDLLPFLRASSQGKVWLVDTLYSASCSIKASNCSPGKLDGERIYVRSICMCAASRLHTRQLYLTETSGWYGFLFRLFGDR